MARQLPLLALLLALFVALSNATDWCSITCKKPGNTHKHVMCQYHQDQPSSRCNQVKKRVLDQSEIDIILKHHNEVRRSVNANLPPLIWDKAIAAVAQRWADQCDYGHDKCRDMGVYHPIGQNVAVSMGSSRKVDLPYLLNRWSDEKRNVNRNIIASYPDEETSGEKYGHYTQIVWRKTTKVGCGFIQYRGPATIGGRSISGNDYINYLVCNYDIAGNFPGQPVY